MVKSANAKLPLLKRENGIARSSIILVFSSVSVSPIILPNNNMNNENMWELTALLRCALFVSVLSP